MWGSIERLEAFKVIAVAADRAPCNYKLFGQLSNNNNESDDLEDEAENDDNTYQKLPIKPQLSVIHYYRSTDSTFPGTFSRLVSQTSW